jgi:hypothetical protein
MTRQVSQASHFGLEIPLLLFLLSAKIAHAASTPEHLSWFLLSIAGSVEYSTYFAIRTYSTKFIYLTIRPVQELILVIVSVTIHLMSGLFP